MRNAARILTFILGAAAAAGCNKHASKSQMDNQDIAIDSDVPDNVVGNADIETLPPDESSVTPSNQLENGFDNPDVNDLGNGH